MSDEPGGGGDPSPIETPPLKLRHNRDFVLLWTGQAMSEFGGAVAGFAYPLLILAVTGSAFAAGLVAAVRTVTTLLFRLPAGSLVDRLDRRRIMVVSDTGRLLVAAVVAALVVFDRLDLAQLLALTVVDATLNMLFGPADSAAVRIIVPAGQRQEAAARNQSRSQLAGLAGPPVGGALYGFGRSLPFIADALSYLVSLVCVLLIRTKLPAPRREQLPGAVPARHGRRQTGAGVGFRFLWRWPFVRVLLLFMALAGGIVVSSNLLLIVLAKHQGASSAQIGVMFAISGAVSAVTAAMTPKILRRYQHGHVAIATAWLVALAMGLITLAQHYYILGLLAGLLAAPGPLLSAVVYGRLAEYVPDEMQGRVGSAARQINVGFMPLAPIGLGAMVDYFGPLWTAAANALLLVVLATMLTASPHVRRTLDDPPEERG